MTNNISIVKYTSDHRDACADLFLRVYNAPPFDFHWLDRPKALHYLADLENTPASLSYVLIENESIIGACLGQKEEHFMNPGYKINEFFIEPGHQHMGIGSQFIMELENKIREHGINTINLFTQRQMSSFAFYKKNGFVPSSETVHMVKAINQESSVIYARTFLNSDN